MSLFHSVLFFCTFVPSGTYQQNSIALLSGIIYQWHHVKIAFLTEWNSSTLTGRNSPNCRVL